MPLNPDPLEAGDTGLPTPWPPAAAIDAAIDRALAERRIVGTVVLAAEHGRQAYARAAGWADREARRPMALDTPFRYASISKPFTVLAALRLMQAGRLDPDQLLRAWLPGFDPRRPDGSTPQLTANDLLLHRAGLDYGFQQPAGGAYEQAGISDGLDDPRPHGRALTLDEELARLARVPLRAEAGWRYSLAIDVLGALVAAVHGRPLPESLHDLVLAPLGLGGRAGHHSQDPRLAVVYVDGADGPRRCDGPDAVPTPGLPTAQIRFDPGRIHRADTFPSGGGGMFGDAAAALAVLEALRDGPFLEAPWRARAAAAGFDSGGESRGPGWNWAWLGALLLDPSAAASPLPAGSFSWGGVYGHSWVIDPSRGRSLIALSNTALEGMNGRFPADLEAALGPH